MRWKPTSFSCVSFRESAIGSGVISEFGNSKGFHMTGHSFNTIVDDELSRQLSDAASDANVAAVFTLRTPEGVPLFFYRCRD